MFRVFAILAIAASVGGCSAQEDASAWSDAERFTCTATTADGSTAAVRQLAIADEGSVARWDGGDALYGFVQETNAADRMFMFPQDGAFQQLSLDGSSGNAMLKKAVIVGSSGRVVEVLQPFTCKAKV